MTTDAKAATIVVLKANDNLFGLVSGRIYYDAESFQVDVEDMPHKAISIYRSGGPEDSGYSETTYERLDLKCWGDTPREAMRVHSEVQNFLKAFTPRNVSTPDGVMRLFNFVRSGGPNELRDPDTDWPLVWSSWLVKSSTHLVSSPVSGSGSS